MISKNTADNPFCAVNPKFLAIITEASGGGAFIVLPLEQYGRVDMNLPKVGGHKSAVLDIQWCPHNDNVIASSSEDTTIKVWHIPDGGLTESLTEPEQTLAYHQRKVLQVQWHPVVFNVILSIGAEGMLLIWDVLNGEILQEITCHPDLIYSASWNPNGSLIGTTCKDKKIRIIDPRTGELKQEADGFPGAKPARIQLINDNKAFLTGFSRSSQRLYTVKDVNDLQKRLIPDVEIDSGSGSLMIFYDGDLNMVYLSAKGDGKLLYYEITQSEPYVFYLNHYQSSDPSRGLGYMPKRGLNVNDHEVARFYKLHQKGICEPIPMIVPRKSDLFQDDIYPPCVSTEPALTLDEWIAGKDAEPNRMDMETLYVGGTAAPAAKKSSKLGRAQPKAEGATNATPKSTPAATPATSSAPKKAPILTASAPASQESKEQKKQIEELLKEVAELKSIVEAQESRIAKLEAQTNIAENGE